MPSPTFHPSCAPGKRPQIDKTAPPSTQAKLDYFLHISLFLSGPWRNLADVFQSICISLFLHPPLQFNHCLSPGPAVIPSTSLPASPFPPLHTSVQPIPLTSYSGGFILLYIQYHKLTFNHELIFFTLEGLYRFTLNRTEVNFEWCHVTLSQGGTVQVKITRGCFVRAASMHSSGNHRKCVSRKASPATLRSSL